MIQIQGIPQPLWAAIQEAAMKAGYTSIAAYARAVLYTATAKSAPRLWDIAVRANRKARGIPDAMYLIHPDLAAREDTTMPHDGFTVPPAKPPTGD